MGKTFGMEAAAKAAARAELAATTLPKYDYGHDHHEQMMIIISWEKTLMIARLSYYINSCTHQPGT